MPTVSADLLESTGEGSIEDYAAIGDCRTAALISRRGSVDWLCLPDFSGPSVFAALLDRERGGRFVVCPRQVVDTQRRYLGDSNVLQTTFVCEKGVLRLTDAMIVLGREAMREEPQPLHELSRLAECVEGEVTLDVLYEIRPDYARCRPRLVPRGKLGWLCDVGGMAAYVYGDIELSPRDAERSTLVGSARLGAGERTRLVFSYTERDTAALSPLSEVAARIEGTRQWWQDWAAPCTYRGRYRRDVVRSCLSLKLLTYHLSGAIVAAATTSLPEAIDADRNWDYRYCWLRDASMLLQSFLDLGFREESEAFLGWLLHATQLTQPRLRVLYDVHGEVGSEERELSSLRGYRGRGPVRIGNSACDQVQHDVYGQVLLTALRFVEQGGELDRADKGLLVGLGRSVRELWRKPDHGIWEIRLPPRHNTHSKLLCWVALDSLLALDARIGLGIDAAAYARERDQIRDDIEAHGFNREVNSYVGYYGGADADASLLLMPRYGYLAADDPRMLVTSRRIEAQLSERGLLYRYPPGGAYDGVEGQENLFVICNFWLVDYLARLGEVDKATALFERLCGLGNDLGLYAEEFDMRSLRPLGNFPQSFSHEGLITAAVALAQATAGKAAGSRTS